MIKPETLQEIKDRFVDVNAEMSLPEVATDPVRMRELSRERGRLAEIVAIIDRYDNASNERRSLKELLAEEPDGELADMADAELASLEESFASIEEDLQLALIPRDPEDERDSILEIRAGTGGDEASLFAGDLFRLYTRFADSRGWKVEVIESSEGTQGGFKEIIMSVQGRDAFGALKYESGVHRVQRVPATESSGRIHTSAATVAVLPEAEDVDLDLQQSDLKIDVYRSSGPGGQSVNTTDSAVRITHIPTGVVVTCQDEKSQHKNKDKALRVLRSRLYDMEMEKRNAERSEARKSMVGSGDRSAKIRTYNYPQDRVTDHRLEGDQKNYPLQTVMGGELDEIVRNLRMAENVERLARL